MFPSLMVALSSNAGDTGPVHEHDAVHKRDREAIREEARVGPLKAVVLSVSGAWPARSFGGLSLQGLPQNRFCGCQLGSKRLLTACTLNLSRHVMYHSDAQLMHGVSVPAQACAVTTCTTPCSQR